MENIATDPVVHQLMKELRFTQIICVVSSLLTLCLLAGGIFLFCRVRGLAESCRPVVEKVEKLDVESLNDTLAHINSSLETVDWEQVAESLSRLDVDAINSAIEKLDVDAINSAIEGLDTEELTQSLKNLNEAVEKIREISDKMSNMTSWVGGIFNRN